MDACIYAILTMGLMNLTTFVVAPLIAKWWAKREMKKEKNNG